MLSSFCWRWASATAVVLFLVSLVPATTAFRHGDLVPMAYKSQQTGSTAVEDWETPWDEALRSQMPRYGRQGVVWFTPGLPDTYSPNGKLAIAFAFSHEQFVLPRVAVTEPSGGVKLDRVVLTFVCSAGDIVRIRADPVYHDATPAEGENSDRSTGFDIEYRWDRLPEEDGQAGLSLVLAVSLIVTVFLGFDVLNSASPEAEELARRGGGDAGGTRRSSSGRVEEERRRR